LVSGYAHVSILLSVVIVPNLNEKVFSDCLNRIMSVWQVWRSLVRR